MRNLCLRSTQPFWLSVGGGRLLLCDLREPLGSMVGTAIAIPVAGQPAVAVVVKSNDTSVISEITEGSCCLGRYLLEKYQESRFWVDEKCTLPDPWRPLTAEEERVLSKTS